MAITGTHLLIYTSEAEAARDALRDAFGFDHVDTGGGWLIFRMPPAELGVHPAETSNAHQISFMCDDAKQTAVDLAEKGVAVDNDFVTHDWGISFNATLPGGVEVMVYEPTHAMAIDS